MKKLIFIACAGAAMPCCAAEAELPIKVALFVDCQRQADEGETTIEQICQERGECCDYQPAPEELNEIEPASGVME